MAISPEQLSRLDKGMTRALKIQEDAHKGALEMCKTGELDISADLHEISGLASQILSVGRRCKDREGKFVARSGSK